MNHYLLWAIGKDQPGFVAGITKPLLDLKCNLEDSSMMRLGSEFAMILILSSKQKIFEQDFGQAAQGLGAKIGIKRISQKQTRFKPPLKNSYIVRVHGKDRMGIVYRVTECLAKHRFNITDLSTHRSTIRKIPGFVLFLEGELPRESRIENVRKDLQKLGLSLQTKITIEPLDSYSL